MSGDGAAGSKKQILSSNTPSTTSAGHFFEAVAALLGIRERNEFEAQAAMELEFAAGPTEAGNEDEELPVPHFLRSPPDRVSAGVLDWEPLLRALLAGRENGASPPLLAARFIEAMSRLILEVARGEARTTVVLSGGCFQNVRLLERTVAILQEDGFTPLWPRRVPPNDGGLALGQAVVAAARLADNPSS